MAQYKKRKPVPKTQSQLTREQIEAYDTTRGTVPASSKQNRENQVSLKNDKTKLPTVSFKDIDAAIFYYFQNVIKPSVIQNSTQIDVPVMYGNPERWSAVQKDGFLRDSNGKIQVPLIMFKKQSIEKNRSLGNKIDGNEVNNFAVFQKKYSKGNIYDQFSRLTNRTPSQEIYGVVIPDYVTVTYQCVIFTDYVEQTDKLIEALNFASDSYWGDKERYRFRAMIDSYTPTIEMNQGQDRSVKTTFTIRLNGYIITDTYNRDKANMKKWHSKSQVSFGLETVGDLETLTAAAGTPQEAAPVRFFDSQIGAYTPPSSAGMNAAQITYLSLNTTAIADTVDSTTATFNNVQIATPPAGFTITEDDFDVYVNGISIPSSQRTTAQSGANVVITFDTAAIQYNMRPEFEIVLVGKFS
tara:strand:+ start:3122 stop:4354 length:1233 start_codon:yes stop_codon:yes gene_type:complete